MSLAFEPAPEHLAVADVVVHDQDHALARGRLCSLCRARRCIDCRASRGHYGLQRDCSACYAFEILRLALCSGPGCTELERADLLHDPGQRHGELARQPNEIDAAHVRMRELVDDGEQPLSIL